MDAQAILAEGRPADALKALSDTVRQAPADAKHRIFMFQLLSVLGQWERALNQLQVAAGLDDGAIAMAQTYREGIQAEVYRDAVFSGRKTPSLFGEPVDWAVKLMEAVRLDATEGPGKGAELRAAALEEAPATPGRLNGEPFQWLADADMRLGPMLEVILQGKYLWVPMERIAKVTIEAPADLRDMVWTPAWFVWANEPDSEGVPGLIPTRYPATVSKGQGADGGALLMSKKTDWEEVAPDQFVGLGQRMLATDNQELGLMDVRTLELGDAVAANPDPDGGGSPAS